MALNTETISTVSDNIATADKLRAHKKRNNEITSHSYRHRFEPTKDKQIKMHEPSEIYEKKIVQWL